jgi:hypothetical protein
LQLPRRDQLAAREERAVAVQLQRRFFNRSVRRLSRACRDQGNDRATLWIGTFVSNVRTR